jgi:hypothetical protein
MVHPRSAPVTAQLKVVEFPATMVVGEAVNDVIDGGGTVTVTVFEALA